MSDLPTNLRELLTQADDALASGQRAHAQSLWEQVLATVPDESSSLFGLARTACEADDWPAAERYLLRAEKAHPQDPAFPNLLSLVYRQQGRLADAIECCRRAVRLTPDSHELHSNLGMTLRQAGQLDEAIECFRRSNQLQPNYSAHYNLGNALFERGDIDAAEVELRRAIELSPRAHEAHNNLGRLLYLQDRHEEARQALELALQLCPGSAEAHVNRAFLRLLHGDFASGWTDLEYRLKLPPLVHQQPSRPTWRGEPLQRRTLRLLVEQGIGDTIQFVRYAALVKLQHPQSQIVLQCPRGWHKLLRSAAGIDRLVDSQDDAGHVDLECRLMSLPGTLGTTLETIPAVAPYLTPDRHRVQTWREDIGGSAKMKVGISWQGNRRYAGDAFRSIALAHFAPLANCPGVKLFSLQKHDGREQLADLGGSMGIVDLAARLDEGTDIFVDTAAAMTHLDLVITSDTAIAHLAGALGVRVWVALPRVPDWRWLSARSDSPWYPTMRLFRQPTVGDWPAVFTQIASALRALT